MTCVLVRQRDVAVEDLQYGVAGWKRRRVAIGAHAQLDHVEHRRRPSGRHERHLIVVSAATVLDRHRVGMTLGQPAGEKGQRPPVAVCVVGRDQPLVDLEELNCGPRRVSLGQSFRQPRRGVPTTERQQPVTAVSHGTPEQIGDHLGGATDCGISGR